MRYRHKKFSFIRQVNIKNYPLIRYKIGSLILILWLLIIFYWIYQELVFNERIDSKIFLLAFVISVIYELFGATPSVTRTKDKIDLKLDMINPGSLGMDLFGSWVGEYDEGLIVYFYLIDYNTIEISKLSKEEIIFSGIEKQSNMEVEVTLKSKNSINYFYPLLSNLGQ